MRVDVYIPVDDYTVTPFLFEMPFHVETSLQLRRDLVSLEGNTSTVDYGVYVASQNLVPLGFDRATTEVRRIAALVTMASPTPEKNETHDPPIPLTIKEGESLYVFLLAGGTDKAVYGNVRLNF